MRRFVFAGLFLLTGLVAAQADTIGNASTVKNDVTGELSSVVAKIPAGGVVSQNEIVRTGNGSATLLKFLDKTNLNIGAMSVVRLDNFVFNPDQSAQSRVVNLTSGALRLVSGATEPAGVAVTTPVATISLRGTDIVVVCDLAVKCAIIVVSGKITVCPYPLSARPAGKCPEQYDLDTTNNFTEVGANGQNTGPGHIDLSTISSIINDVVAGNPVGVPGIIPVSGPAPADLNGIIGLLGTGTGLGLGIFLLHNDKPMSP